MSPVLNPVLGPVFDLALNPATARAWEDAMAGACLFAVAPYQLGGIALRAGAGPVRDRWMALLLERLEPAAPVRRVPVQIGDGRLLGGLDLSATLKSGRPVLERGVLEHANGGLVVLAMAERMSAGLAARLASVMDTGEVCLERDGLASRAAARFGVLALDEGLQDEVPPAALLDRLPFQPDLHALALRDLTECPITIAQVAQARRTFTDVTIPETVMQALCATALALGVWSLRMALLCCQAARAAAALDGRLVVDETDATLVGRLILAPLATCLPAADVEASADAPTAPDLVPPQDAAPPPEMDGAKPSDEASAQASDQPGDSAAPPPDSPQHKPPEPAARPEDGLAGSAPMPMDEVVLSATQAAIPAELLARLRVTERGSARAGSGRVGALQSSASRGRPSGTRRGELGGAARIHVIETLRAAAPWQKLRRQQRALQHPDRQARIEVHREDIHLRRYVQRAQTTTIFVVDASGSAALHRLAETKGAVELLLSECYVRRDQVAVLGFRQNQAQLLLPPTRSLVRAKRSLAGLAAGGGTPLAAALDAAATLADQLRRRGTTPIVVLLSDGRANVARDGSRGRERADADAMHSALGLRIAQLTALFIDTSPQPGLTGQRIATQMGAQYLALPYADASALSRAVKVVLQ